MDNKSIPNNSNRRNVQTEKFCKTTQEITPITVKDTSSSFINKSLFNQNKRNDELKDFKQYLTSFQPNSHESLNLVQSNPISTLKSYQTFSNRDLNSKTVKKLYL
jgi:hypothetical protein